MYKMPTFLVLSLATTVTVLSSWKDKSVSAPARAVKNHKSSGFCKSYSKNATCADYAVHIPEVFSPNGYETGSNFYIKGSEIKIVKLMKVYDKLGKTVFEARNISANDPAAGWNGKIDGELAGASTFIYSFFVETNAGDSLNYQGFTSIR